MLQADVETDDTRCPSRSRLKRTLAAPMASWVARLMPTPPTGDMPRQHGNAQQASARKLSQGYLYLNNFSHSNVIVCKNSGMITLMLRSTDLTSRSKRCALLLTAAVIPLASGTCQSS